MQIVVDELLTNFERDGKGKTVVIVPGWADTVAGWRSFADELAKKYDVIVLDLPGFGGSEMPKEPWGLDDYAKFVAAFLKKLEVKPYAILGHSNGGAIAMRGLCAEILQAEKLLLFASAGIRNQAKGRNRAFKIVAKTGKVLAKPLPDKTQRKLRQKLYKTAGSDMLVAGHMQETFKKIVSHDVADDACHLRLPTLLIYGENDQDTPVRYGETLYELIDNSTLEILPGAGHFVHHDREADVLKAALEFLA
jgi:pimeloyl-ACP methyl ester carboxylesterase